MAIRSKRCRVPFFEARQSRRKPPCIPGHFYRSCKEKTLTGLNLVAAFLVASLLLSTPLQADGILVIGDSWAEPLGNALAEVLSENGVADVPVHTTPYWGGPRNLDTPEGRDAIAGWLEQWPGVDYLYMMMGQNNWLCCWTADMIGTQEETELFESIIDHTENVLDYILSIRPDIQVVWTSGEYFRPHHLGTPSQINANHDRLADLAADFSNGRPELTFLEWNGILQVVWGFNGVPHTEFDPTYIIPPGDPSLPDPTLPSPQVTFDNAAHPNRQGYKTLAKTLFDRYFFTRLSHSDFQINPGLNDAWFNPATNGQGFFISVLPERKQIFLAWFTFDSERPPEGTAALLGEPGHRWLTAQGSYEGDRASLTLFVTKGGEFDAAVPVPSTNPSGDGTLVLEFADCTQGLLSYAITSLDISGEIPIERIVPDNAALCETLGALPRSAVQSELPGIQ
jgi:hypothetical protein